MFDREDPYDSPRCDGEDVRSETESLLRRFRRADADALQFEHEGLRFRAAGRGEARIVGNAHARR